MYKKLEEALIKYKIELSNESIKKLWNFAEILKKYNQIHNLTAITDDIDIIYKHLLDSLLPIKLFSNQKILDIGCGGGFPCVPLAIANPNINIIGVDSVGKKVNFVNNVVNELNISNLYAFHTRIEDMATNSDYRESFDIVTSRAVAPLNIILEYSAPMLKNDGIIIAYKGSNFEEEISNAKNAMKILDCEIMGCIKINIEETASTRAILVIKKKSDISKKYPRKQNKPRLQPL